MSPEAQSTSFRESSRFAAQRPRSRPSSTMAGINSKGPNFEQGASSTPVRIDLSALETTEAGRTLAAQIEKTRGIVAQEIGQKGKERIYPGSVRPNIIDVHKLPEEILELLTANISKNGIATEPFIVSEDPTASSRQTLLEYLKANGMWDYVESDEQEEQEPIAHQKGHEFGKDINETV